MAVRHFPTIRAATAADAAALGAVKLATFRETFVQGFAIPYPPADLARFEADSYGPARIAAELADPAHRTWVVEEATEGTGDPSNGGRLAGYVHVGPCKLPHADVRPDEMELSQLYLRRAAQGRGIGLALLDHALGWLDGQGGGAVWLGMWSGNSRARTLYAGRGFVAVGAYQFAVGDWRDDETIMRRSTR